MIRSWITPGRFALIFGAVGLIAIYTIWSEMSRPLTFRYKLTVDIVLDGHPRSAASIIEVDYFLGKFEFVKWQTRFRGVSPVLDLGPKGTLVAALEDDIEDLKTRQTYNSSTFPPYRVPFDAGGVPLGAYKLPEPHTIKSQRGKAELDPNYYPIFIWFPPSNDWHEAKQMFFDEIEQRGPAGVSVTKITVEPAPGLALKFRIDPAPVWLERARQDAIGRKVRPPWGQYFFSSSYIERGTPNE